MQIDNELINPDEKLYNLDKLKEISRGDSAFVKRMIKVFTDRTPSSLMKIKEAYYLNDFKTVRDIAHLLKPSIDNIGITIIKNDIRSVEELAIENPASELLLENINKIGTVLMLVCEQLNEELK